MFNAGKLSSFSVYSRLFFFFCNSGAERGFAFISFGGGRLVLDFDDEPPDGFPLLPEPLEVAVLPAEGFTGAMIVEGCGSSSC